MAFAPISASYTGVFTRDAPAKGPAPLDDTLCTTSQHGSRADVAPGKSAFPGRAELPGPKALPHLQGHLPIRRLRTSWRRPQK